MSCLGLLPHFFWLGWYWIVWAVYIFLELIPCQLFCLQTFFTLFCGLSLKCHCMLYSAGAQLGGLWWPKLGGTRFVGRGYKKEGIYVHIVDSLYFFAPQKLAQSCEITISQIKWNKMNKQQKKIQTNWHSCLTSLPCGRKIILIPLLFYSSCHFHLLFSLHVKVGIITLCFSTYLSKHMGVFPFENVTEVNGIHFSIFCKSNRVSPVVVLCQLLCQLLNKGIFKISY